MKTIKGQTSLELILVISALMFFFILFLGALQQNNAEKTKIYNNKLIEEFVLNFKQEIELAFDSRDGYSRTFELPTKILNQDYSFQINENSLYLITEDEKYAYSVEIKEITGQPTKGINTIKKIEGKIILNG